MSQNNTGLIGSMLAAMAAVAGTAEMRRGPMLHMSRPMHMMRTRNQRQYRRDARRLGVSVSKLKGS